jgi:hypothetical protein
MHGDMGLGAPTADVPTRHVNREMVMASAVVTM